MDALRTNGLTHPHFVATKIFTNVPPAVCLLVLLFVWHPVLHIVCVLIIRLRHCSPSLPYRINTTQAFASACAISRLDRLRCSCHCFRSLSLSLILSNYCSLYRQLSLVIVLRSLARSLTFSCYHPSFAHSLPYFLPLLFLTTCSFARRRSLRQRVVHLFCSS